MKNLEELAAALRAARTRISPAEVGMPAGARRRVRGLRREEVAQLAGISVDYLVRLEQGRGPRPSDSVLAALARALRLTDDERDRLFHLAGSAPPRPGHIDGIVRASTFSGTARQPGGQHPGRGRAHRRRVGGQPSGRGGPLARRPWHATSARQPARRQPPLLPPLG